MSDNVQNINQTLSEAQEYYIRLFKKWQKWQQESPEKLPESKYINDINHYKTLDFDDLIEEVKSGINGFFIDFKRLANHDNDLDTIIIEPINSRHNVNLYITEIYIMFY